MKFLLLQDGSRYMEPFLSAAHKYNVSYVVHKIDESKAASLVGKLAEVIATEGITHCLPLKDTSALLLAAAVRGSLIKYIHPTLESIIIATYKPFVYQFLMEEQEQPEYKIVSVKDLADLSEEERVQIFTNITQSIKGDTLFLKPTTGTASANVGKIANKVSALHLFFEEHLGQLSAADKGVPDLALSLFESKLQNKLALTMEPLPVLQGSFLVEPYRATPLKAGADFLVWNGQVFFYCLTNNIYFDDYPEQFFGIFAPSLLPAKIEEKIKERSQQMLEKLVKQFGFDNQFIDIEWFITLSEDGQTFELAVMEVNPRMFSMFDATYQRVFTTSCSEEFVKLCSGISLAPEQLKRKCFKDTNVPVCGFLGYVSACTKGKTSEIIFEDTVQEMESQNRSELESGSRPLVFMDGARNNEHFQTAGNYVHVIGDSLEDCYLKFIDVANKLVRPSVEANWRKQSEIDKMIGKYIRAIKLAKENFG